MPVYEILNKSDKFEEYSILLLPNNSEYKVMVFHNSYKRRPNYTERVTEDFNKYNISKCKVLFDMVARVGNSSDRYFEVLFDGTSFDKSSVNVIQLKKKDILRKISADYMINHLDLDNFYTLTTAQKNLLKHDIPT